MSSVPFLPEELSGSDEGSGVFELPSDNVGPLVEFEGQISVTLDPVSVGRIHNSFAGRPDGNGLSKIAFSRFGHPSNFGSKTFDMVFFNLERTFGNEHGEVSIFDSVGFNESIEESLYLLPD
jgi:hypothetical protein